MKSKKIISEVAKIRSLFDYRRGVVISEQGRDIQSDVGAIRKEIQRFNSDEQVIVDILKQYTTKDEFQKFVDTYKQTNNIDFGTDLARALQPSRDKKEWDELKTSLEKLGITMGDTTVNDGREPYIFFKGLKTPWAPTRSKIISGLFCSVKNGKIVSPDSQMNNVTWDAFTKTYKPTPQELADAAKSCPDAELSKKQTATQFTKNENFPLKFQQQGEKIKQLQTALDVRNKANQPNITGKFWTATENAVKAKAAELGLTYDRSKGVDEQMFNKFMEAYNTGIGSFKPKEQTGSLPSTARTIPTTGTGNLPSTAGTLPTTGTAPVGPTP